jgi:hypothetical protein
MFDGRARDADDRAEARTLEDNARCIVMWRGSDGMNVD